MRAVASLVRAAGLIRHPLLVHRALRRYGTTLPGAVALAALRNPHAVALRRGEETSTFAALHAAVQADAMRLSAEWPEGTRVGVRSDGGIGTIVRIAAAIAAGIDVVPLGSRLGAADAAAVARDLALVAVLDPDQPDARDLPDTRAALERRPGRLLLLSSGSTGLPKATMRAEMSWRMLRPLAELDRRISWPRGPVLVLAPLDHGHGLSAVVSALVRGDTALLASEMPMSEVVGLASSWQPTSATGVPLQLQRAHAAGALRSVARVVSGSSHLDDVVASRLIESGATLIDCLGTTETGTFAVRRPPHGFVPLPGVRLRVDDQGLLRVRTPLAAGEIGTGDRAERTATGFRLRGRADGLIDAAGELLSPARIRTVLDAMGEVHACEVEAVDDELRGSAVVARVVLHAGADAGRLRSALEHAVGRGGMPHRLEIAVLSES